MNQQNIKLWTDQLIRLISINEITSISDDDLNTYISDLVNAIIYAMLKCVQTPLVLISCPEL